MKFLIKNELCQHKPNNETNAHYSLDSEFPKVKKGIEKALFILEGLFWYFGHLAINKNIPILKENYRKPLNF